MTTGEHHNSLRDYAIEMGFPEDTIDLYIEAVEAEMKMRRSDRLIDRHQRLAASDPSYDGDRQVYTQNIRLRQLRQALSTTEVGRQSLAQIPPGIDDGDSTIPVPLGIFKE